MEAWPVLLTLGAVQLAAVATPGPNFFLVSQTAAREGRRAGLSVAAGVCAGAVLWCAAALLGLEIVLRQAAWAIRVLQFTGGLYLIWIGWKMMRSRGNKGLAAPVLRYPFWQGFTTSLANPKVILFFGSVLSAVFDPSLPAWAKWAALGIVTFNEVWWYVAVVLLFSTDVMQRTYARAGIWLDRVLGALLFGFGLRLCWGARN